MLYQLKLHAHRHNIDDSELIMY